MDIDIINPKVSEHGARLVAVEAKLDIAGAETTATVQSNRAIDSLHIELSPEFASAIGEIKHGIEDIGHRLRRVEEATWPAHDQLPPVEGAQAADEGEQQAELAEQPTASTGDPAATEQQAQLAAEDDPKDGA